MCQSLVLFIPLEFIFLKNSYKSTAFVMWDSVCILSIIYCFKLQDVDVTQEPFS